MRPTEELATVRRRARERLVHPDTFADVMARLTQGAPGVVIHCHEHIGGRTRKLAEAYWVNPEILFVSHIHWLPSDLLNLRPWEREQLLGSGWNHHLDEDDEMLSTWLDHLDDWETGVEPHGDRWLRGTSGPHVIRSVLVAGETPIITPWVRCPDHPEAARTLSVPELMAGLRVS